MTDPRPYIPPTQNRRLVDARDRLTRVERYPDPTILQIKVMSDTTTVSVGDAALVFVISDDLEGLSLLKANAFVSTASSAGDVTVQLRNVITSDDMLSTPITIPALAFTSYPPATPSVVDDPLAVIATGDLIAIDIDAAGAGAMGLGVVLTLGVPSV